MHLLVTTPLPLTELYNREALRSAKRVSNPGCYATNTQLLLAPLLPYISAQPTVFGVSGYSGAGTAKSSVPKIPAEALRGGIRPYSLTDHIHEREAGFHLSQYQQGGKGGAGFDLGVAFIPTVAPWFQGIISTASVPLKETMRADTLRQLYKDTYKDEKLVEIVRDVPEIADISKKHGWKVGGFQIHSSGKRAVIVVSGVSTGSNCFVSIAFLGILPLPPCQHEGTSRRAVTTSRSTTKTDILPFAPSPPAS